MIDNISISLYVYIFLCAKNMEKHSSMCSNRNYLIYTFIYIYMYMCVPIHVELCLNTRKIVCSDYVQ